MKCMERRRKRDRSFASRTAHPLNTVFIKKDALVNVGLFRYLEEKRIGISAFKTMDSF